MKQQTKSSNITVGLDLGDRRHRFCALDERGEVVEEGSICNDRVSLRKLAGRYHGALGVMEAGAHSPWISRFLEARGWRVVVSNPRKVRAIYQHERKSDQRDALMLARIGRMGPGPALSGSSRHGGGATGSLAHQAARQPGASSSGGDQFCALHAQESWLHGA